jgi:GNAT superfamily N-acetyltransferase
VSAWTGKGPLQLEEHHNIQGFDCGNQHINKWIEDHARNNSRRLHCKVFVFLEPSSDVVAALYTITMRSIERDKLTSKYRSNAPNSGIPAYFIGQFAVALQWQRRGLGRLMLESLYDFLREQMINGVPAPLIYLDALEEEAAAFWRKQEFQHFPKINQCSYIRGTAFLCRR